MEYPVATIIVEVNSINNVTENFGVIRKLHLHLLLLRFFKATLESSLEELYAVAE